MSRPSRGAWIEIEKISVAVKVEVSRAPRGARGLKSKLSDDGRGYAGVAPLAGRVD